MRKLMEAIEKINEAPPRKKVRLRAKPKLVKKKAGKTQARKIKKGSKKIWMYGDEEFEKVSGPIPASFILAYMEALSTEDNDKEIDLTEILAEKTTDQFARIFGNSLFGSPEDLADMKKVLAGGSAGFGETEYIAGFGPTKAKAKAAYDDYVGDPEETRDEGDWDY